jgi:hypothetical protein
MRRTRSTSLVRLLPLLALCGLAGCVVAPAPGYYGASPGYYGPAPGPEVVVPVPPVYLGPVYHPWGYGRPWR